MTLLRAATTADLEALLEVQRVGAVEALAHIFDQRTHPFPTDRVLARWAADLADPGMGVYVVEDQTEGILGFAATRGDEFLHFGTAKHTWGTGVAADAHDLVLDQMRSAGVTRAWLRVFEANHRARRFYERLGWSLTGRRSRTSFAPHPVLLEYDRELQDPPKTMRGER